MGSIASPSVSLSEFPSLSSGTSVGENGSGRYAAAGMVLANSPSGLVSGLDTVMPSSAREIRCITNCGVGVENFCHDGGLGEDGTLLWEIFDDRVLAAEIECGCHRSKEVSLVRPRSRNEERSRSSRIVSNCCVALEVLVILGDAEIDVRMPRLRVRLGETFHPQELLVSGSGGRGGQTCSLPVGLSTLQQARVQSRHNFHASAVLTTKDR